MCRGRAAALLLLALAAAAPARAQAGDELEQGRRRIEEIRAERERLARERERLRGEAHDVQDELTNLARQRETTARIMTELERQMGGLASQIDRSTAELILAQDNLAERQAVLERRLVDIYKRGSLYTYQVLLSADGFGNLLSRYKYLYLTSRQDRALVTDVTDLRNRIVARRNDILHVRGELDRRRAEREAEFSRFGSLARERAQQLRRLERSTEAAERRLKDLANSESRLNTVLAAIEKSRREAAAAAAAARARGAPAPAASPRAPASDAPALTTASLGRLDWPVDGTIVYRFGRDTLPSGGVIRRLGIGIAAPAGTPVKAIEGGTVRLLSPLGTYGLTAIVEHGNGYYSVYAQLVNPAIAVGDAVKRGQVLASVGGENSDYGPHLHFEIRGDNQQALDPTEWLRRRP